MSNYYCVIRESEGMLDIVAICEGRNGREVWSKLGYRMEAYPLTMFADSIVYLQPEHEVDPELIERFRAHA